MNMACQHFSYMIFSPARLPAFISNRMEFKIPNFCVWYLYVMTLLISTNLFIPTTLVTAFENETDRLTLLKFKDAIATDPNGLLKSWNDSTHFCKWQGITCGTRHQRVTALELQDHDLHGTISPYIGNLSFLRYINLSTNSFSGTIPQQLDQLFRLRGLDLSYNKLEGRIPVNLSFCTQFKKIDFLSNRLNGKIPSELGSLTKLVYLSLETNNLTGGIPPSIGNLSSISVLSLADNNLGGNVPEEIGRLKNLTYFSIGPNKLSGMIPAPIFNISSMEVFSLVVNEFEGSIPSDIGLYMPNLQGLYLAGNRFFGHIPASLSNASQLQEIALSINNFVGKVPTFFGDLPHLQRLTLANNALGSYSANDLEFITALTNCSELSVLDAAHNKFGGVLPNSVANLSTSLTKFYLGYNHVSGTLPETLPILENLIILSLMDNLLTGVIPTSFGNFQSLQVLALDSNKLSGQIPSSIGNLTQLFALYLPANQLEKSIPPSIGNCQKLQELQLSENMLSGEIPPQVIGVSSVLYLNLSHNLLTGNLPVEVSNLKNMDTLDISENNLTGEVPKVIGDCLNLQVLLLQGNHFQGIIPSSLAFLKVLQHLDLSQNNLSGQIPTDIQKLPFLQYVNLSFNNLEGEVPKEGAFRNKSAISLVGNNKLCGGVLELQLSACSIKESKWRKMHGFKLKLTISLVVCCFLLFAALFALYWRRQMRKKSFTEDSSISFFPKVSYHTLHQATNGFSSSNLIGAGGFGSVYRGILDGEENKVVAIKVLNLQQRGASKSFMAECNALRNIRHRNLVKILTSCSSIDQSGNEFKALVLEYMSNGNLEEWLHNQSRSLNLLQRLNIVYDVAFALCYLHDHCQPQIIHCDVKPSNVLLDDDMVAHVGDFGLARLIPMITDSLENRSSTIGIKGTIGYAAPEYASGVEVSRHGDIYSYGILVLEMFTGRRPTDELFGDGLNLHNSVEMAITTGRLMEIVDRTLLATLEETTPGTTKPEVSYLSDYNIDIEEEKVNIEHGNLSQMNTYMRKCILPVLKIGLACSEESPRNRMCMEDVIRDLHHIKNAYVGVEIRQES